MTLFTASLALAEAEEVIKPPRDAAYQLVWSDEFEKDGPPDSTKWESEKGFARNEELQWYQPQNSRCEGGLLIIEAKKEIVPNPYFSKDSRDWRRKRSAAHYTSGSLITNGRNEWTFGRYEIRAKFKALPGIWPAIWTTGNGRWPHGGEIDLMEFYGGHILANFVWAGKWGRDFWQSAKKPVTEFAKNNWDDHFHLWVMEWNKEKIELYLDGKLLNTLDMKTTVNDDGPKVNPFLSPHRIRLNLAVGANAGDPGKTEFPQRYAVDYVRIYQKKP